MAGTTQRVNVYNYPDNATGSRIPVIRMQPAQTPNVIHIEEVAPPAWSRDRENQLLMPTLLRLLPFSVYTDKSQWLAISQALHNTFKGNRQQAIDLISNLFTRLNAGVRGLETLQTIIRDFRICTKNEAITVKTVAHILQVADPEGYSLWHNAWCAEALENALQYGDDHHLGELIYRYLWQEFVCTIEGDWHAFHNHGWEADKQQIILHQRLVETIVPVFRNAFENEPNVAPAPARAPAGEPRRQRRRLNDGGALPIGDDALSDDDDDDDEGVNNHVEHTRNKTIGKLIRKLHTYSSKVGLVKEMRGFFLELRFEALCDTNLALMRWQNGVTECLKDYCTFRRGRPEDYLTKSTHHVFDTTLTMDSDSVQAGLYFLAQMFPDKQVNKYIRMVQASLLYAKNVHKRLHIFSGKIGDNAKTTWQNILMELLGDYAVTLDMSVLTQSKKSGGPNPELARLEHVHLLMFAEPDENISCLGSIVKRITGNDKIFARNCNQNGKDIGLCMNTFIPCNNPPSVESGGKPAQNRMVVIDCLTCFIPNPPATEDEQWLRRRFLRDELFADKHKDTLMSAFAFLMFNDYPMFHAFGNLIPESIQHSTREYWSQTNTFARFIRECFLPTLRLDDALLFNDIQDTYKLWYQKRFDKPAHFNNNFRQNIVQNIPNFDFPADGNLGEVIYGFTLQQPI